MKILILILALSFSHSSLANDSVEALSGLRFEIEEKAQKLQQEIKFRKEAEEVLLSKINEKKNKILKERLKASEIANELLSFKVADRKDQKTISTNSFEQFHSVIQKDLLQLQGKFPFSFDLKSQMNELDGFYQQGQAEAYQIVLVQTLEKALFDVSRASSQIETHTVDGKIKNIEVLRLGGWMALGKLGESAWIYGAKTGQWQPLEASEATSVRKLFEEFKKKKSNFVSQDVVSLKEKYL